MTSTPTAPADAAPTAAPPPAPKKAARRPRLGALDALRFIAAAVVVGYHLTGIATSYWGVAPREVFPTLNHVTRYGYLGVELFFIISGFVILMTAWGRDLPGFAASRIARLFPAYWVAVVITLVLQAFWKGGRDQGFVGGLINLTMTQDAWNVLSAQGAFWTLWIELKFYLLIGVFLLVGITKQRVIAMVFLWPLLAQIARTTDSGVLNSLLFAEYAPFFAMGMALFLIYRFGNSFVAWLAVGYNVILGIRQATAYADRATELVGAPVSPVVTGLAILAFAALVWLVSAGPLGRVEARFLSTLGALTYPLYLVHAQFAFWIIDVFHGRFDEYVVLAAAVSTALVLAIALHYLIERRLHDPVRDAVLRGLRETSVTGR
ncbi:peptidoglycan/LPS O-acetylase OafA/YrhL [Nocardioides luteus]|uniref:Acyltransferase n=1 Tax=Nocardioides luteus TaxID=1844 RepID=A0ABQ5SXQ7_9ACTN|nr:acyltransferase [Nocardioides luteus]MDR7312700.1 peptidoglycan/LPS O-acetylase OafA/YrhL [Nocardioides luteus]GGR46963.1 acyltransferase [Nocardioides luteus]GLJ68953.1 acyltransferase [Nocardioides luteus]